MFPGDKPEHEVTLINLRAVDNSADPDFNNVQVNEILVSDYTAGTGRDWGHRAGTHPDGDKMYMSFEGTAKTVIKPDGSPDTTFEGKWWYTGGTGKFKGITGDGTYKGKATAEGITYTWEGEYEIK